MISIIHYIRNFSEHFAEQQSWLPWNFPAALPELLEAKIGELNRHYFITRNIAVHHTAKVESSAIVKGPAIIGPDCFIGAHAYIRGGVFLDSKVSIGPGCEVKASIIFSQSAVAHFNFIGDSIIGHGVNVEAGAVIANHFNERQDKMIRVKHNEEIIETGVIKFGALAGDDCRIGANAVLSPGTILLPGSIVKRLQLVDQVPEYL